MWSIGERYVPTILQITSTLILTRMIMPSDFAEVALITVIIDLLTLFVSSGLGDGLIYKNENSSLMYSSVFILNTSIAVLLYLILLSVSGLISSFYGIPRLRFLIYVAGLNMIFYALSYVHRTMYSIKLDFKTPATITFLSTIIGCMVGLIMAFNNYGVWAIVFQSLTITASQSVMFWIKNNWRPMLVFSWSELYEILPFSARIFLYNLIQSIYDNIYTLLLGKFQPARSLGFYSRMQTVVFFTTTNLAYSLAQVYYPMLSKIKDDMDGLREKYLMISRLTIYAAFPILVILIGVGKDIIVLILTDNWAGGYEILRMLCCAFFFMPLIYINNTYMKLLSETRILFYTGIFRKMIGVSILLITITSTMTKILLGIILTFFIEWLVTSMCIQRYLKVSMMRQIVNILPTLVVNSFVVVLLMWIGRYFDFIYSRIIISFFSAVIIYILWPVFFKTKEYFDLKALIKK